MGDERREARVTVVRAGFDHGDRPADVDRPGDGFHLSALPPLRSSGMAAPETEHRTDELCDLRIEWCTPDDAEVMRQITFRAFESQASLDPPSGAVSETVDKVRDDLVSGRGVLAWMGAGPVGACRVVVHADPDRYHVRRLAVAPEVRRRGIARAIMRWLEDEAAAEGMSEIRLGVRNTLTSNFALYEGLGYETVCDHGIWTELRKPLRIEPTLREMPR